MAAEYSVYCVKDGKETVHITSMARNGELVLRCKCGSILKFPAKISAKEMEKLIKAHNKANEGLIPIIE